MLLVKPANRRFQVKGNKLSTRSARSGSGGITGCHSSARPEESECGNPSMCIKDSSAAAEYQPSGHAASSISNIAAATGSSNLSPVDLTSKSGNQTTDQGKCHLFRSLISLVCRLTMFSHSQTVKKRQTAYSMTWPGKILLGPGGDPRRAWCPFLPCFRSGLFCYTNHCQEARP